MWNRGWLILSLLWLLLVVWSYSSAGHMEGHWWFAVLPLTVGVIVKLMYRFVRFGLIARR